MSSVSMNKIVFVSQLVDGVQKVSENDFRFPEALIYKGVSSRFYKETVGYLNKQISKDRREYEKFVFENILDPHTRTLERRIEFHYVSGEDFFQDQKNELLGQQLQNVLMVISRVLDDLGGEVHKASFYYEDNSEAVSREFAYKLNSEGEFDFAKFYIDKVFSKARLDEKFQVSVVNRMFEFDVLAVSNIPFVADESVTVVREVDGLLKSSSTVYLKDPDTERLQKYAFMPEQLSDLIALCDTCKKAIFRYRPNLKSNLGQEIECGGWIEEIISIKEETLL